MKLKMTDKQTRQYDLVSDILQLVSGPNGPVRIKHVDIDWQEGAPETGAILVTVGKTEATGLFVLKGGQMLNFVLKFEWADTIESAWFKSNTTVEIGISVYGGPNQLMSFPYKGEEAFSLQRIEMALLGLEKVHAWVARYVAAEEKKRLGR